MIVLFAAVRAIHFASLMSIFGAGAYLILLRHYLHLVPAPMNALRIVFTAAATLALLTAAIWLGLVAGQMSGDWWASHDPATVWNVVRDTKFGQIFAIRIAGLCVLWIICVRQQGWRNAVAPILAGLLLGALGLTSHAAASSGALALVRAANDAIHLLAAGFWIGGLIVLALMQTHRIVPADLLQPLRLFSLWGTYAVTALVVTGVINAASILRVSSVLWTDAYVEVLLVKVVLASLMIALAVINRWRVAPALRAGNTKVTRALAINVAAEIVLGAAIIGIAGYLGLMPPR